MKTPLAKKLLLQKITRGFTRTGWKLEDCVILNNHYHLMVTAPEDATRLSRIMQDIHKFAAIELKNHISVLSNQKKIFYNYRDTCITNSRSYFARIHYLWFNPVRHHCVDDPSKWKFGSYFFRIKDDKEYTDKIIRDYPIDRLQIEDNF